MSQHIAELLLELRLHGVRDAFRKKHPFSADIASLNAILFNPDYTRRTKRAAYKQWLESFQPCVFGRVAATNGFVFVCLVEEHEILNMKRGDDDLRDTIQDHRQVWKRYALDGLNSAFLILLVLPSVVDKEPTGPVKELCRRLLELYMEVEQVPDDTILTQREYVFLRTGEKVLKFSTLPNIFCTQADGRWWHDHRTPGGVMTTSNSPGHFAHARPQLASLDDKHKIQQLEHAMRTIANAYPGLEKKRPRGLTHCPATWLVSRAEGEATPIKETSPLSKHSPDHYQGYFHTDHLIPSVFFSPERDPQDLQTFDNLSLRYLFDPAGDPSDHADLMTGTPAISYDLRRNMDRLPDFADPEKTTPLTPKQRGKLEHWLRSRLEQRLVS